MTDLLPLSRRLAGAPDEQALERINEFGERLRSEFAAACADVSILARLTGPAQEMRYEFEDQENAPATRILEHFVLELRERGLEGDQFVRPDPNWTSAELGRACSGLRANVVRLRGLLIEFNSYLSGGVPWVFPAAHPTVEARGLARYRFPARGGVHLGVEEQALRIRFEPGPLGEITSSGFYVPTLLAGDLRIALDYEIEQWSPGDDAACLALYVHDAAVLEKTYVQRSASREDGELHFLLANFSDSPTERQGVQGSRGSFRIERQGTHVRCFHRSSGADWVLVGEHRERSTEPMITGAKIWSKIDSGGFDVLLRNWSIEAEIPAEQPPEAETRPDPRA